MLRFWSICVLAHFFTVDVTIGAGHELIRHGPYRMLRHPPYTGALMTFLGFGLALGNAWSLLVLMVPVTIAFLWRIRIEGAVLADAFSGLWTMCGRPRDCSLLMVRPRRSRRCELRIRFSRIG